MKNKNSEYYCVFLRANSKEIRKKIREANISVCACAEFEDANWLNCYPRTEMCFDVHGEGYWDETDLQENRNSEAQHQIFLYELKEHCKKYNVKYLDCGEDVDLFINTIKGE